MAGGVEPSEMKARGVTEIETELGGVRAVLMPERAVYVPGERVLLVADTHWGKAEAMRRGGVGVPTGTGDEQRARLTRAIERSGARRVVVVGDLVHAPIGLSDRVIERARTWVAAVHELGVEAIEVVEGNHDAKLGRERLGAFLEEVGIVGLGREARLTCGLVLRHHPPEEAPGDGAWAMAEPRGYVVCGHVHPAAVVRGRGDEIKMPCFWADQGRCVLPAFSRFIAGKRIVRRAGDRVFAAAGDRVVEVPRGVG